MNLLSLAIQKASELPLTPSLSPLGGERDGVRGQLAGEGRHARSTFERFSPQMEERVAGGG